ncbi:MAG: hypothetical protein WA707_16675, partial [Pseudolabrys sp.]|jgi:hypothetical protein
MGGQNTRMPNGTVARLIYFAFFLNMTGREKSKPSSAMRGGGGYFWWLTAPGLNHQTGRTFSI